MRLAVVGANGRMGRELIRTISMIDGVTLSAALVRSGSKFSGLPITILGGVENAVKITDKPEDAFRNCDAIIDFTLPEISIHYATLAVEAGKIFITGTTGFDDEQERHIKEAAKKIAIVKSGNMSLGVNLLSALVKKAATALDARDFDIEIAEMHHRRKVDAPSGTAILLGKAAASGRGVNLADVSVRGRDGNTGIRETGTIGFSSLRGGTVIGDHSVIFAGENERIELTHLAQDRSIFAHGAIKAALWAKDQSNGLYSMLDVLGLTV